jgi:CubicO group peptidase (beta-lactamase class C family)
VRLLSAAAVEQARARQAEDMDALHGVWIRMALGFWLTRPGAPGFAFSPNEGAFGHAGAGGSLGFADPKARLGFGYVTNRMGRSIEIDPRAQALVDAVYAS